MSKRPTYSFFQLIRLLSLDVAFGAIASGSMAVYVIDIPMAISWWLVLPLSVWVMYTLDHLLDARKLGIQAHTDRHLFHHYYFRPVAAIWLLAFLFCIFFFPWFLPWRILLMGGIMGLMVLLHLGIVKWVGSRVSLFFMKELGVGVIYSTGVWGGPLIMGWPDIEWAVFGCFMQFFLLVMINLLVFSMYEKETDELDGQTSFVRAIGVRRTCYLIFFLIGLLLIISMVLLFMAYSPAILKVQLLFLLMYVCLGLIAYRSDWFQQNERYRVLGDAVFLIPVLIWIL